MRYENRQYVLANQIGHQPPASIVRVDEQPSSVGVEPLEELLGLGVRLDLLPGDQEAVARIVVPRWHRRIGLANDRRDTDGVHAIRSDDEISGDHRPVCEGQGGAVRTLRSRIHSVKL